MTGVQEVAFQATGPVTMAPGLLTPLPWPDWTARLRALEVDGVRADYVEMGPYDIDVPPVEDRPDLPIRMMLVIVLDGISHGRIAGQRLTLSPRQAAIISGRTAMRFHAPQPVRALRLFVDEDHLPVDALRSPDLPFVRLKHSPLVTGCMGLISGLLQVSSPTVPPQDELAVSQPLIALMTALLDEALHAHEVVTGPTDTAQRSAAGRREQVEAFIDDHLADRDLSVGTIAGALGVAVRTVHAAFDGSGTTVGAEIRARRVAKAETLIALRQDPPNVGALAERVGLSRDQLTRAFQAATGATVRQWWERHHVHEPTPPARQAG